VQKLEPKALERIKQKLITSLPLVIVTEHNAMSNREEEQTRKNSKRKKIKKLREVKHGERV
jgi:hypothetical protein